MYVKLFGSILDSSIWSADLATRVVWITMLAMADEYGIVYASVDGLANRARISVAECRRALRLLAKGDRHSRTKNDRGTKLQGRRIEEVDGGWQVINYQKYRELRSRRQIADAARQARHRRHAVTARDTVVTPVTSHDITVEAEAEAEAKDGAPVARVAWVIRLGKVWETAYGGSPAWGQIGKALKRLVDTHGIEAVEVRWHRYLRETEARYASPTRFAQTFGAWDTAVTSARTLHHTCANHPERDATITKGRIWLCSECFDAA